MERTPVNDIMPSSGFALTLKFCSFMLQGVVKLYQNQ